MRLACVFSHIRFCLRLLSFLTMTHMAQVLSNRPAIPMVLLLGFHTVLVPNRYIKYQDRGAKAVAVHICRVSSVGRATVS